MPVPAQAPVARGSILSDRLGTPAQPPQEAAAPSSARGGGSALPPLLPPPPVAHDRAAMRALSGPVAREGAASKALSGLQDPAACEGKAAASGANLVSTEGEIGKPPTDGVPGPMSKGAPDKDISGPHPVGDADDHIEFGGFVG